MLLNICSQPKLEDLFTDLPEDIDLVEYYVFDYNRFLASGKIGYVRMNIFYNNKKNWRISNQLPANSKISVRFF